MCNDPVKLYTCSAMYTISTSHADLEHHKVIVSVLPIQESYEIGSQVTLKCIAPQTYGNFVLPQFYYRWSSITRQGYFFHSYSSTGSNSYFFTISKSHPKSADYHCDIYRNGQFLGSGKTTVIIKGIPGYYNCAW